MKVEHISITILAVLVVAVSGLFLTEICDPAIAGQHSSSIMGAVIGRGSVSSPPNPDSDNSGFGSATRTIVDMNGRTVTIPSNITKVFCTTTSPSFVYVLAPDKVVSWPATSQAPSNASLKYIPKEYQNLPIISTSDYEAIIAAHPDIVIIESNNPDDVEKVQKKLGSIPVVSIISWHYVKVAEFEKIFRFLGDVLGVPDKAETEATYIRTVIDEIKSNVSTIPESGRLRVLYTADAAGLQPGHVGLPHTEWINICGGINVVGGDRVWSSSTASVTKESVLKWKPDVILTLSPVFFDRVYDDEFWKQIPAVQNHRVYLIPTVPFNWFDRPHGVNSIVGLPWTAHALYPEKFSEEWARAREKEFFATFYHYNLSDEELTSLLNG
jgi:iron complex transport system substrate-binding protein